MMDKNKQNQAKCEACGSWHLALNLDEKGNILEIKCCRCGRLEHFEPKLNVFLDKVSVTIGKLEE